ncbi:hypothetical protein BDR26DRAFT_865935 [Obelidium mucronatum]|nr:hypothetical protein BDR26DRAFT_865925 [Obelidium mucronatum]KAI9335543.1 hypothetical protein BDR26DRAFT_865935 [Obelidium mucronatum]
MGSLSPTSEQREHIFDLALVDDVPCIVAAKALIPRAAVVVYPHEWVFETLEQARQHLTQSPQLVSALSSLIMSVNVIQGVSSEAVIDPVQHIVDNLPRIAFSYQITSLSADGETEQVKTYYYCIVSDPFGPAVIPPAADGTTPMLASFVFVDQRTMKAYTVLFPGWIKQNAENEDGFFTADDDDEDTIPEQTVITRGPLLAFQPIS